MKGPDIMKFFKINAHIRTMNSNRIFAEIVEAETAEQAKIIFNQKFFSAWIDRITEI